MAISRMMNLGGQNFFFVGGPAADRKWGRCRRFVDHHGSMLESEII
jgi:hypothetical protein